MFWEAWPAKGSADDLTLDTANSVSCVRGFHPPPSASREAEARCLKYMSACTSAGVDLLAPVGAFFQVSQRRAPSLLSSFKRSYLPSFTSTGPPKQRQQLRLQLEQLPATEPLRSFPPFLASCSVGACP